MAQTGYTPISLYYSTTASAVPTNTNLANGELAINITDGKLYYKDNTGTVKLLAGATAGPAGGSTTQVQYNSSGVLAGSANMTFDGTTLTAAGFSGPHNGTVGATTANTGAFTTLSASSTVTLSGGTANGVTYLNGSKVLTSGSALTFDGTNLGLGVATNANIRFTLRTSAQTDAAFVADNGVNTGFRVQFASGLTSIGNDFNNPLAFLTNNAEGMRLTSTGLGIGTSSPYAKVESTQATGGYGGWKYALGLNATDFPAMRFLATTGNTGNLIAHEAGSLVFLTGTTATTAGTERLRLSSAGNLGLGVTPSAWSAYKAIQTSGASFIGYSDGASNNQAMVVANAFYDSTDNWKYIYTDNATRYRQFDGEHQWSTAASGTAGTNVSFTQAMTLDASGNLGVGTTSPSARFSAAITAAQNTNTQVFTATDSTYCDFNVYLNRVTTLATSSAVIDTSAGILALKTSNTERARIDASGNLLVGTTTQFSGTARLSITATTGAQNVLQTRPTTNITYYPALFENSSGTTVGYIQSTSAATAYVTTSDYRLKNSIAPITGALNKVSQLKPCTYKWNADGSDGEGFIAHELAEVVPQCVSGGKDAVDEEGNPKYQGIDTSFLVATLTAAIQEQQAIIESLKARLDAANL